MTLSPKHAPTGGQNWTAPILLVVLMAITIPTASLANASSRSNLLSGTVRVPAATSRTVYGNPILLSRETAGLKLRSIRRQQHLRWVRLQRAQRHAAWVYSQQIARVASTAASAPIVSVATAPTVTSTVSHGANWAAIAACESGGNWSINTGNGFWGGLQFTPGTWFAYGGGPFSGSGPFPYSAAAQIAVGERVLAAQGPGAWPNCYRSA